MKESLSILIFLLLIGCSHPKYDNPHVLIKTGMGDIEVELFTTKAPKSAAAFLQNVEKGLYKNSAFYRVLKTDEMPTDFNTGLIQGGIYNSEKAKTMKVDSVPHERTDQTGLSNVNGAVSFAHSGPGTATTEFFICIGDQSPLDANRSGTADGQGYAVFGKVFKGMKVVRKIQARPSHGDKMDEKLEIIDIEKL